MTSISRHQKRRRSADHTSTNEYLGSLVMNGKELVSDVSRLGYCAMANGNIVLGISRSDKVKDYVEERGGSFFRQFILVSDGVLPAKFQLHGKVELRALDYIQGTIECWKIELSLLMSHNHPQRVLAILAQPMFHVKGILAMGILHQALRVILLAMR